MKSCVFEGQVRHRRFQPRVNNFKYPLFMLYLDLDELPNLFDRTFLWSSSRFSFAWFRRKDHLFDHSKNLKNEVQDIVKHETGKECDGPIRLLTHLRYCGYYFNPLSLFYCFDRCGEHVEHIVAEVNNTPWGERHCYVLSSKNRKHENNLWYRHGKAFHVSPFMDSNMDYFWKFTEPSKTLVAHIENRSRDNTIFDATLTMHRKAITGFNLSVLLIRYPFMTLQVIILIYWQALKIFLKRIPYVKKFEHNNPVSS